MATDVHVLQDREGRISSWYRTLGGERVWVIDWDDRGLNPPVEIEEGLDLQVGCRVRLAGGRLERVA